MMLETEESIPSNSISYLYKRIYKQNQTFLKTKLTLYRFYVPYLKSSADVKITTFWEENGGGEAADFEMDL